MTWCVQLTYAVLGSFMKYPRQSVVEGLDSSKKVSEKKFGYFRAEADNFNEVASGLGLKKKTGFSDS